MCAPAPESSGSTTSTLAPLVMADWAMLNWVASLPSAFWMVKSEVDSPAVVKACLRYGASNSTYRVDETVSGRITAMVPLPAEATDLRPAIAVKELLRWLTEIGAAGALLVAGATVAGVEVVLLLLHAAISSAAVVAATAVRPALADMEYNDVPRLLDVAGFRRDLDAA